MHDRMTVDGLPVPIRSGDTILTACRRAGITIPTLCYHPGLEPYGACRLCVVEVHGDGRDSPATRSESDSSAAPGPAAPPKAASGLLVASSRAGPGRVVASCTTPPQPGLDISTVSAPVLRVRRAVMAFLLERCPRSETLLRLAEDLGIPPRPAVGAEPFGGASAGESGATPEVAPDGAPAGGPAAPSAGAWGGASGLPPVPPELEQMCVLCGRCVQACEKLGHFAIGFAGRSIARRVMPPFGASSEACTACGACTEVCPTGAVRLVVESGVRPVEAAGATPTVPTPTAHLPAWRTTVPLCACRSCGRPLWNERLTPSAPAHMADLCPTCRRKHALTLAFNRPT